MNNDRLIGLWLGVAVLMGAAFDVSALTVGRVRGGALLGQPLQITVPVQYAADEDISASCFSAEVWYGDFRQDLGRTSVTFEPATGTQSAAVRIVSSGPVSEPVVHLTLVAGCKDKTTRRYSILADAVTQPAAPMATAAPVAIAVAKPAAAPVASAATAPAAETAVVAPKVAAKPKAEKPAKAASTKNTGSKLTLTPTESGTAPKAAVASKAAANAVQAAQIESLEKRVGAVEDWKSQVTNPDGSPKEDAKLKTLETDLKGLQAVTAKNQQSVQILTQAVDKIQSEQSNNSLLYVFGALLTACVAALGFVMMKVRGSVQQAMPWWRAAAQSGNSSVSVSKPSGSSAPTLAKQAVPAKAPASAAVVDKDAVDSSNVDLDIDIPHETHVPEAPKAVTVAPSAPERVDKRDFQPSGSASLRAINTREMLDVRQQAEFFMALGQHDDAIKALESSIHASADSNPLVYLDLLRVLSTLSRKAEFDRYRREFNHIFTGKVPEYSEFNNEGHSLESYPEICRQIAELWPTDDALDYIEQCLVRTPEDGEDDGFDMEAFRDLLMLHGMLRRNGDATDSRMQPFIASRLPTQSAPAPISARAPLAATSGPENAPLPSLQMPAAPAPVAPNINVVDAGDSQVDLTAASRDLNLAAEDGAASLDLELDLDLGAEEKPGNLIDFDISVGNYETKDEAPKK